MARFQVCSGCCTDAVGDPVSRAPRLPRLARLGKFRPRRGLRETGSGRVAPNPTHGAGPSAEYPNAPAQRDQCARQGGGRRGMAGDGAAAAGKSHSIARCIDGGDRDAPGVHFHPDGRAGGARACRGGTRGKAKQDHAERCADRLAPVVGRGPPHRAGPGHDRDVAYRQPRGRALSLFFVATALAASLLLLMAHDQPFNAGGFFLRPTLLREVVVN